MYRSFKGAFDVVAGVFVGTLAWSVDEWLALACQVLCYASIEETIPPGRTAAAFYDPSPEGNFKLERISQLRSRSDTGIWIEATSGEAKPRGGGLGKLQLKN